jgi:mannose-6-phosphate isomerase-like protein (cupin superfamily)
VKTRYPDVEPYTTKDGSTIRELMHPQVHGNRNQSFAEAVIAPGASTSLHCHAVTEEIYHVTAGNGTMTLGDDQFPIGPGDTVCIPPGTAHRVQNTGTEPLRILCACSPPYSHDDTRLI